MNIFGGVPVKPSEYYSQLSGIHERLEKQEISVEEFNKMLLLIIGSQCKHTHEVVSRYQELAQECTVATAPTMYLIQMQQYVEQGGDGHKIPMIKYMRYISGLGLKEAKEFVEEHFQWDEEGRICRNW